MNDQAPMPNFLFVPYVYTATSGSILTTAQAIVPLLTDQDADFECHRIFGTSNNDDPTDIRPNNFTFQIADKSNGRNWSDSLMDQRLASAVEGGWMLTRPVLLAARSNLSITIVSTSADTQIVKIAFVGFKVLQYKN